MTAPLLLDVSPGCKVWHKLPIDEPPVGVWRRGGIVWAIEETRDEDTGFPKRRFFVIDLRRRLHFDVLEEEEINRDMVDPPAPASVRNAVRRLCAEIGERKGMWMTDDMRRLDAAQRLAGTIVPSSTR